MAERKPSPAVVIAGVVVTLIALAMLVVLFTSTRKRGDFELCKTNLQRIDVAMRRGELFDSPAWDAVGRGRSFLAGQDRWPSRYPLPLDLTCPVKGEHREIDYRGPALPLRQLTVADPMCADREGNHGPGRGGNVLLKDGTVREAAEGDALWARAAETTSD